MLSYFKRKCLAELFTLWALKCDRDWTPINVITYLLEEGLIDEDKVEDLLLRPLTDPNPTNYQEEEK